MAEGVQALTDREKQTLRLLLVGHDAKSIARHFGLSVHTVNERLRDARRKLSVSSSKEAARMLLRSEGADPQIIGHEPFGDAGAASKVQQEAAPDTVPWSARPAAWVLGGCIMLTFLAAVLAVAMPTAAPSGAAPSGVPAPAVESAASKAARDWLALVDDGRWQESWAGTGRSFQSVNTVQAWRSASEKARVPLGRVLTRTLVSDQDTPSPPNGYRVVRFRTDFANRGGATETLSLDREGGDWRVVGIYIE